VPPEKMAIIGDRLYTDIALGCNNSIITYCVLSGETDIEDIRSSIWRPDQVISSINFLNGAFKTDKNQVPVSSLISS